MFSKTSQLRYRSGDLTIGGLKIRVTRVICVIRDSEKKTDAASKITQPPFSKIFIP